MKPLRSLAIPLLATTVVLGACGTDGDSQSAPTSAPAATSEVASPAPSTSIEAAAEYRERDPEDFLVDDRFYVLELADSPFPFMCAIGPDSEQSFYCATNFGGTDPQPAFEANEPLEYWDNVALLQFDPVLGYNPVLNHPMESMPPHGLLEEGETVTLSGHRFTREADTITVEKGIHKATVGVDSFHTNAGIHPIAHNMSDALLGEQCGEISPADAANVTVFPLADHTDCTEGLEVMGEYLAFLASPSNDTSDPTDEPEITTEAAAPTDVVPTAWEGPHGWTCGPDYVLPYHQAEGATMNPTCTAGDHQHQVVALPHTELS